MASSVLKVLVSGRQDRTRAVHTCRALKTSIHRSSDRLVEFEEEADVVIMYGMSPSHCKLIKTLQDKRKPFFVMDLGYWLRGSARDDFAHYKIAFNYHHPNKHWDMLPDTPTRWMRYRIGIRPWKKVLGSSILLAGMGPKSDYAYGYQKQEWDIKTVADIRTVTNRRIIYRPKPSDRHPIRPRGTELSTNARLEQDLSQSMCVVTHHSNVACDALLAGIPAIAADGAAAAVTYNDPKKVEEAFIDLDRMKFFSKLAHCQWSLSEMKNGSCWDFLVSNYELRDYVDGQRKVSCVHRVGFA